MPEFESISIENFLSFLNYKPIILEITGIDRRALQKALKTDYVNHAIELERYPERNYMVVNNCDLVLYESWNNAAIDIVSTVLQKRPCVNIYTYRLMENSTQSGSYYAIK